MYPAPLTAPTGEDKPRRLWRIIDPECLIWVAALLALGFSDPGGTHYSLCVFRWLGWEHCPGCGLGHSIAFLLRGDLASSFHSHPLGPFALAILLHRIGVLSIRMYQKLKSPQYGFQQPVDPFGH